MKNKSGESAFAVRFAGWEVSLEVPRWREWRMKNGEWRMPKIKAREDFFAPVWEGLGVGRSAMRLQVLAPQHPNSWAPAARLFVFACAPNSISVPWGIRFSKRLEAQVSMILGTVLVGLGLSAVGLWAGPMVYGEVRQVIYELNKTEVEEKVEQVTFADYVAADPVVATITPASQEFSVVIPKIQVNSVVIPRVNANDKTQYMAALKQGLAHAAGTALPGEPGDTYIFGHSTDFEWNIANWNALFYNLKDLELGDKVYVWYEGMPRIYQVTDKQVYEPKDTSFINLEGGEERLVLQTCTPPGTTWKRLVVFAEPIPIVKKL